MKRLIPAIACTFIFVSVVFANEELDKQLQDMQEISKAIEKENQKKEHAKYLENNDREKEISQRTGPTVEVKDGTPSVGYQWSTD